MQPLVPINSAAVSRDGRYIAVGLEDRAVVLWDTAIGRPVRTLFGHQKPVHSVAFSPDGEAPPVRLPPTRPPSCGTSRPARRSAPTRATPARSSRSRSAPTASSSSPARRTGRRSSGRRQTGEPVHTLKSKGILGVAYSPDGTTLATASADFTATLWDAKTGKQTVVLRGHREDVTCIAFSPDSKRVITGSYDDTGIVWDAATGKRITPTGAPHQRRPLGRLHPRRPARHHGEREELVLMWDAATGAHVRTFVGHIADIHSIVPSPDGRTMLTGSRDGTARLWDLATGRELLTLTTDATRKTWAVVSPGRAVRRARKRAAACSGTASPSRRREIDQFFAEGYRPGLLAEVWRGERPFPAKPLGRSKPPLVKLVRAEGTQLPPRRPRRSRWT